jgi:hypothetical protein
MYPPPCQSPKKSAPTETISEALEKITSQELSSP